MGKITKNYVWGFMLLCMIACTKNPVDKAVVEETKTSVIQPTCATMEVLARQMQADPTLADKMNAIEMQTNNFISKSILNSKNESLVSATNGVIEIPIAVHVIAFGPQFPGNISDAQIESQMIVINKDFSATNDDFNFTPDIFKNVASNFQMHFTLKSLDRKFTTSRWLWGLGDDCKTPSKGGVAPVNPSKTLNIWICNIDGGNYLGFSQYPGVDPATSGIVIDPQFFGTIGTVKEPYNKGRTVTHEIGHWLNLQHIWGTAPCGNDFVSDTPVHEKPNGGCPIFPKRNICTGNVEMTMNYMDYTWDGCKFMFTNGQKLRARALFVPGGPRFGFMLPH